MAKKDQKPKEEKPREEEGVTEIPGQVSLSRSPFKLKGKLRYLSTDIDALHKYVLEKKKVRLLEAAKRFKTTREIVEDWANILEDHGMIEMHYPVAGDPTLRVPGIKKEKKHKTKKEKGKKVKKKGKSRFTKKRIFIMAELIVLGEILIYIFLVNPHLRNNFIPTLNYQIANLPANLMNLPTYLSTIRWPINPLYIIAAIVIVIVWIIAAALRKRKKAPKKPKIEPKKKK